jgi:oxalate---CoA ligase
VRHPAGLTQLHHWATERPDSAAIVSPSGDAASYRTIATVLDTVGAGLRAMGVRRGDVVGIVAPNGAFAATAFLTVANAATAAPLNPAYREPEFAFYMGDLGLKALLVPKGFSPAAEAVAADLGIPVVHPRVAEDAEPGVFDLGTGGGLDDAAGPDDVALVLHTSGTTSRPKMVPLRHRNLAASAANVARSLALTADDRCLNVMPLFHIHGLVAAVLASLHAGGSVVCTPGFAGPDFFDWVRTVEPTWYTAVPTIHQAIVERAEREEVPNDTTLRLARSSSSSLAPQVMASVEKVLGVPVIEAYGMTEAAHQIASNPLPPDVRRPGSVGPAAGPDVAIMDDGGTLLGTGTEGEIVIRGANVMDGYLANDEANRGAFTAGWFRTGDLGHLDGDGYLTISGRKKEIINRGGETISPREIDEVLLDHPSISQALAFAVPDARLGEQVAAAVVLAPGSGPITESEIRRHVSGRLSDAKVPRAIVFLDEIPKGPTGKLQRIGMAERLGIAELDAVGSDRPFTPPTTTIEVLLADIWRRVLDIDEVSIHDRFLDVGGDSLMAARLLAAIRTEAGIELTMLDLSERATIAEQAAFVEDRLLAGDDDA